MTDDRSPRKIEGWQFFDSNAAAADDIPSVEFHELDADNQQAANLFVDTLAGCRRVLDVGCGGGFPGLYVAPHVGEIVGIDAAPNVIARARANIGRLRLPNVAFELGLAQDLPYAEAEFDGAMLCGVLESMDHDNVPRTLSEVRRVLQEGAVIAVLDQDWDDIMRTRAAAEASIRLERERLTLVVADRATRPHTERYTWYLVDPDSRSGRLLQDQLGDNARVPTTVTPQILDEKDILDAWYDETAQFDAEALVSVLESAGFHDVRMRSAPIWDQPILFATAHR